MSRWECEEKAEVLHYAGPVYGRTVKSFAIGYGAAELTGPDTIEFFWEHIEKSCRNGDSLTFNFYEDSNFLDRTKPITVSKVEFMSPILDPDSHEKLPKGIMEGKWGPLKGRGRHLLSRCSIFAKTESVMLA
jgi:hypothetical protein